MDKTVKESEAELSRLVLPEDTNMFNNLYGGRLMEWMDNIASITAFKHCRKKIVTGSIDNLFFLSPIKLSYIVNIKSFITYVTRSTMEIEIDVSAEDLTTGEKHLTTRAFFTYVAVDDNGRPLEVPGLILSNDEEKKRFNDGVLRHNNRLKLLKETRESLK
jgi:acyl-CoA hydrolase